MEIGELVRARAELHRTRGAAHEPRGECRRILHLVAECEVGQERPHRSVGLAAERTIDPVLGRGETRRFRAGGDIRQRIDGDPAGQRIGRAVDVHRDEDRRTQPPGDRRALFQGQVSIVVAGQGYAHAAALHQQVADLTRERQRQVLFLHRARNTGRSRVPAAVTGVEQNDGSSRNARFGHLDVADGLGKLDGQPALSRFTDQRAVNRRVRWRPAPETDEHADAEHRDGAEDRRHARPTAQTRKADHPSLITAPGAPRQMVAARNCQC
ncbi:hypothetical protein H9L12_08155 [Sphingomonas rhizophila]|uniref:Uncharacterized protein n=1 Tax=Sphingomonas rhizophila TaxID=2071607 RepID=A0A7G9SEQ2_9SPHN|nr:hypothetical protein [Sphingomonas rhizophila]QNN66327.1 hypothetical protein H9L12_08155 [Sphingomonas rhizophila]